MFLTSNYFDMYEQNSWKILNKQVVCLTRLSEPSKNSNQREAATHIPELVLANMGKGLHIMSNRVNKGYERKVGVVGVER